MDHSGGLKFSKYGFRINTIIIRKWCKIIYKAYNNQIIKNRVKIIKKSYIFFKV